MAFQASFDLKSCAQKPATSLGDLGARQVKGEVIRSCDRPPATSSTANLPLAGAEDAGFANELDVRASL